MLVNMGLQGACIVYRTTPTILLLLLLLVLVLVSRNPGMVSLGEERVTMADLLPKPSGRASSSGPRTQQPALTCTYQVSRESEQ